MTNWLYYPFYFAIHLQFHVYLTRSHSDEHHSKIDEPRKKLQKNNTIQFDSKKTLSAVGWHLLLQPYLLSSMKHEWIQFCYILCGGWAPLNLNMFLFLPFANRGEKFNRIEITNRLWIDQWDVIHICRVNSECNIDDQLHIIALNLINSRTAWTRERMKGTDNQKWQRIYFVAWMENSQ